MGFQSQAGQVGFRAQAVKGAYLDPGAAAPNDGIFVKLRSGGLGGDRQLLIPDPEIGGGRDISDAYLGPVKFGGDLEAYVRGESIATFLYGALGSKATVGAMGKTYGVDADYTATHTITPTDSDLPWYSVEEALGDGFEEFKYTDCKFNTLHLEADAEGFLMCSVGLVGLSQEAGITKTASPNWDNNPMIVGSNITVDWSGSPLPAKSFSFDVNNNLEDNDFRLGSLFLGDATEKRREFNIGVKIRPEDSDLWRTAMYGDPGLTVAGGEVTRDEVVITCETYEVIGTSAIPFSVAITVPLAVIKPYAVTPSGDDVIEHDFEITPIRPDPADDILEAVVVNGWNKIA